LYCYVPFKVERGEQPCPACGEVQTRHEQAKYWTQEGSFLHWERGLQWGSVLVCIGLAIGLSKIMEPAMLPWGVGLIACLGALFWYTAGCVTRRSSFMDLRYLWPPLVLCIALGPLLLAWLSGLIDGKPVGAEVFAQGGKWALPWVLPLVASVWIPRVFHRIRRERVEQGPRA